jgi:hypothetical protein
MVGMEPLLSIIEAAAKLGVTRQRVYVWVREGRIPTIKIDVPYEPYPVLRIKESDCVIPKTKKFGRKPKGTPRPPQKAKKLGRKPYKRKQPVALP